MAGSDNNLDWSYQNLRTVFKALNKIDDKLNGKLRTMVYGTEFKIVGGGNAYYGEARADGTGVDFHVALGVQSETPTEIPLINIVHETGHLLDTRPATNDKYSGPLGNTPTWVSNGFANNDLLLGNYRDPIQSFLIVDNAGNHVEANSPNEYWADAFTNYVLDNINTSQSAGSDMYNYVNNSLNHPELFYAPWP